MVVMDFDSYRADAIYITDFRIWYFIWHIIFYGSKLTI